MREAKEFINRYHSFVVSTHVGPDGDAIGAMLGLIEILLNLGKEGRPFNEDALPDSLAFLPGSEKIIHSANDLPPARAVIVLDCGDEDRPGPGMRTYIGKRPVLNIDHHTTNTVFGDANWVDPKASSTSEMIVELAHAQNARVSADAATCLYTGILTDTGSFHYGNTTEKTMRVAAEMVGAGANPEAVASNCYHSQPPGRLGLLTKFMNAMEYGSDNRRADSTLTLEDYKEFNAGPDLSENFINILTDVGEVRVAVFYRQIGEASWKVSMRAKGEVDVSAIAKGHGGGGHKNAAGCNMSGSIDQVKKQIRDQVDKLLEGD